jgi:lipoprotein-releasing system ATP-binding protein
MSKALEITDLCKAYRQGAHTVPVLDGLNLTIATGEFVALLGPSGSGKSTLLSIAGLLDVADSGEVRIGGHAYATASHAERNRARQQHLGFVYQFHHLMPEFTALENVMLAQLVAGHSRGDATTNARKVLEAFGLGHRLEHRPHALSGGEQQRVAIARAVVNKPALVLADEPTGNLDPETATHVFSYLRELSKTHGIALFMATHNLELGRQADRVVKMEEGGVV